MTQEQITEGNKLIAELMGLDVLPENSVYFERFKWSDGAYYSMDRLKYHSSWDWLMPVVEKIEAITGLAVLSQGKATNIAWGNYSITTEASTRMESIYNACIHFIQYYNTQSK